MRRIFLVLLFLLFASLVVAQDTGLDTGFYEDTGIEEEDLSGCGDACTFEDGKLTLTEGTVLILDEIPSDLIIEANGGVIKLPEGDEITMGTLDTNTMTLKEGSLSLKQGSSLDINFENSQVTPFKRVDVLGSGVVENGQIVLIEKGNLLIEGNDQQIFVENLYSPTFVENVKVGETMVGSRGDLLLEAPIYQDTKIGMGDGHVRIESSSSIGGSFVYGQGYLTCTDSCHYTIEGNPELFIGGSDIEYEEYRIHGAKELYTSSKINTKTFSFEDGKKHTFEGPLYFAQDMVLVADPPAIAAQPLEREGINPFYVQSVDGIYFSRDKTPVQVVFDEEFPLSGNSVGLYDEYMRMVGDGYTLAYGDVGGGNPNPYFPYSFTQQNKYVPTQAEDSTFRLLVQMEGGDVEFHKKSGFYVDDGDVAIANGVNLVNYHNDEGEIKYDYTYSPCSGHLPGKELHVACAEVSVPIQDGGTVNVVTEQGTGYELEEGKETLLIQTSGSGKVAAADHQYTFDKSKAYVLGYKGGEAAKTLVGTELEYKEWGHVGLLYYKDGKWWVAEEDGANAKVRHISDSLFTGKLHGAWEINVDDPRPIISAAESAAGSTYKKYTSSYPFVEGSQGYSCSGFCTMAIQAGLNGEMDHSVGFSDLGEGTTFSFGTQLFEAMAASVEPTPRWILIDNPHLTRLPDELGNEEPVLINTLEKKD